MSINKHYWKNLPEDMLNLVCTKMEGTPEEKLTLLEIETLDKFDLLRRSPSFLVPLLMGLGGVISSVALFKLGASVGITVLALGALSVFLAFLVLGLQAIVVGLQWMVAVAGIKAQLSIRSFSEMAEDLKLTEEQVSYYYSSLFEDGHTKITKIIKKVEDEFEGNEHE